MRNHALLGFTHHCSQLGRGIEDQFPNESGGHLVSPVQLGTGRRPIAVAAGGAHSCALLEVVGVAAGGVDREIKCCECVC
jgi:hypothetical protein